MSSTVSALNGKVEAGDVTIREAGLQGMVVLRGDLSDRKLQSVCKKVTGVAFPDRGRAEVADGKGLTWMSPDEVLLLVPHGEAVEAVSKIDAALKGTHFLAQNLSDARALIHVEGPYAREVIAKLAPVDLHPDAFGPGDFRRSRLGQVAAAFWMETEGRFGVVTFRSNAHYAFDLLAAAAKGGPVGHLTPAG